MLMACRRGRRRAIDISLFPTSKSHPTSRFRVQLKFLYNVSFRRFFLFLYQSFRTILLVFVQPDASVQGCHVRRSLDPSVENVSSC